MRRSGVRILGAAAILAFIAGCSSVDYLAEYEFRDRSLGSRMLAPPEPQVFADFDARIDRSDPIGTVIRVGTSIAKAAQVHETRERLKLVLDAVNVPEEIRRTSLDQFVDVLGCEPEERSGRADVILELDIREYGISAKSWTAAAEFRVSLLAVLRDGRDRREIWRARVEEKEPITPSVFGLGGAVGNVMSAVALSELSDEEIGRGMMRLGQRVAYRAADRLSEDLRKASVN
jgi:hypothetical protein